jgi:hypothetical protein
MGDVINLNKFRKERARQAERKAAGRNRVRFGRSGAEKAAARIEAEREDEALDGKKRKPPATDGTGTTAPDKKDTPGVGEDT